MASTGLTIALIKALASAGIDPSSLEQALAEYLEEHPEALQTDVQINGTSITSQGVANIPIAGNTFGVCKTNADYNGIGTSSGYLYVAKASDSKVLAGGNEYNPIVPYNQHKAAFFGLAKAAGADMKDVSGATVGTYTDTAKVAIQKMLGVYEPQFELLNDFTLEEESSVELTKDSNNVPYNLREIIIIFNYPANAVSATGYGRYGIYDSDNNYAYTESGRYNTNTSKAFKIIHLMRKSNMSMVNHIPVTTIGSSNSWQMKNPLTNSLSFTLGNAVKIKTQESDTEPAGTNIKVYGQRAY